MLVECINRSIHYVKPKEASSSHGILEMLSMWLLVISVGCGEIVALAGIKLSYIALLTYLFIAIFTNRLNIRVLSSNTKIRYLQCMLYIWAAYALIQFIWISDSNTYFSSLRSLYINIIEILIIIDYVKSMQDFKLVLESILTLLFLSLIVGFWEILTNNHLVNVEFENANISTVTYWATRPRAFYGNLNDYATFLVIGLYAVFVYMCVYCDNLRKFSIMLIVISATIYQIIFIGSRAATMSMFMLLAITVLLFLSIYINRNNQKARFILQLIIVIIAISLFINAISVDGIAGILQHFSGNSSDYVSDLFRYKIIVDGFTAFLNSFGFGLGAGQSILINNINLHSFYLEILVDYGLMVGGSVIVAFASLFLFNQSFRSDTRARCLVAVIRSFPIVLVLLGVASSSMFKLRVFWILFTCIYLLAFGGIGYWEENQHNSNVG